jgi:hypothetical protein
MPTPSCYGFMHSIRHWLAVDSHVVTQSTNFSPELTKPHLGRQRNEKFLSQRLKQSAAIGEHERVRVQLLGHAVAQAMPLEAMQSMHVWSRHTLTPRPHLDLMQSISQSP